MSKVFQRVMMAFVFLFLYGSGDIHIRVRESLSGRSVTYPLQWRSRDSDNR